MLTGSAYLFSWVFASQARVFPLPQLRALFDLDFFVFSADQHWQVLKDKELSKVWLSCLRVFEDIRTCVRVCMYLGL